MAVFHRKGVPFEDPLRVLPRALTKFYSLWVNMTYPFASKGRDFSIDYTADLLRSTAHRIKIGNSVVIHKDAAVHVRAPLENNGEPVIVLDDGCVVGPRSTISAKNCIHLEPDVMFGPSALIQDHSHAYEDVTLSIKSQGITEGGRIRIGQGCWIGHGAVIHCDKGELILGHHCIVSANSLVTKSCPPYSVIGGNPARVVKQFDPVKGTWVLGSSRSVDIDPGKQESPGTNVGRS